MLQPVLALAGEEEVPATFEAEEEEVVFDDEEEAGAPDRPEIDIEQEDSTWLLVLPLLCVALLAWNVQWRKPK